VSSITTGVPEGIDVVVVVVVGVPLEPGEVHATPSALTIPSTIEIDTTRRRLDQSP
jgi:hypothetical protein